MVGEAAAQRRRRENRRSARVQSGGGSARRDARLKSDTDCNVTYTFSLKKSTDARLYASLSCAFERTLRHTLRRYRRAPLHRMACLGLLYIHASASTSLTSLRSATSASLRASVSVSRRFSSLSTVSSATDQACSFCASEEGNARSYAVSRPSGYRRTHPSGETLRRESGGRRSSARRFVRRRRARARRCCSFQRDRTWRGRDVSRRI